MSTISALVLASRPLCEFKAEILDMKAFSPRGNQKPSCDGIREPPDAYTVSITSVMSLSSKFIRSGRSMAKMCCAVDAAFTPCPMPDTMPWEDFVRGASAADGFIDCIWVLHHLLVLINTGRWSTLRVRASWSIVLPTVLTWPPKQWLAQMSRKK